jgi:hypothetical protein
VPGGVKHALRNLSQDDEQLCLENPAVIAEQKRRFAIIKDFLTAPELGTS